MNVPKEHSIGTLRKRQHRQMHSSIILEIKIFLKKIQEHAVSVNNHFKSTISIKEYIKENLRMKQKIIFDRSECIKEAQVWLAFAAINPMTKHWYEASFDSHLKPIK